MILVIDDDIYEIDPPALRVLDAALADAFRDVWLPRVTSALIRWRKNNPTSDAAAIQRAAKEIAEKLWFAKPIADDPILSEAKAMARHHIETSLAAQGLPLPRNLDDHIAVLCTNADLLARAKQVVTARLALSSRLTDGAAK